MKQKSTSFRFKKADLGIFKSKNVKYVLRDFKKDCRILGLTMGEFSLIDLIHGILKKTGAADVVCVTWSAGIKDAHNVKWLKDQDYINSFKLITDHSYKSRQKKYALSIEELFGIENIRTSEIHAKFVLISNEKYKVSVRTSMNLNANKTCENFEIDEDESIYIFYKEFVQFIFKNQDNGFIEESKIVNKNLNLFINNKNTIQGWSEL